MLQKEIQTRYQNKAQWFSLNMIQEISGIFGDYYLKKYENKIGIIYKGKDRNDNLQMNYYENNEKVSSIAFQYKTVAKSENSIELESSGNSCFPSCSYIQYNSEDIEQNPYCFCGKLEYFYYIKQQAGEIVQCNLKTLICKTYNFEERALNCLKYIQGIKKTNYIIISWIDPVNSQSLIEIRDSAEFQIKYQFKLIYRIYKILHTNLQQSLIAITDYESGDKRIRYYSIREQNLFSLFSFHNGKIESKITEMENYLIITTTDFSKFELRSLILKGKIIRKLCRNKVDFKIRIKKYKNYYLLQGKLPHCTCYQIYQWWNGKVVYSSKIKELLNGKITSRGKKAKKTVYILKYQPNVAIRARLIPKIDGFQLPAINTQNVIQ